MKSGIIEIGNQIISVIEKLDNQAYQQPLEIFNGSTLGQHFRHILEFFENLSKAESQSIIDYAKRDRDPQLESDKDLAIMVLKNAIHKLALMDESINLSAKGDYYGVNPVDRPILPSSVGREMMFIYDHAIHHLAIIKIGIKSGFPHIAINENTGMAPSTIRFRIGN
jgi:hypothetical protein